MKCNYAENGEDSLATFSSSDPDADADDVEWSLEGVDKDIFTIDGGVLAFKKSPSFESAKDADEDKAASGNQGKGDNVYKVTVVASGTKQAVEVTVTDVEEEGEVTFKQLKPQVSRTLTAEASDPDGGVTKQRWQWYRGENSDGPWTAIEGAKSPSRSPVEADIDNYLRVVVTYTDRRGADKTAEGVTDEMVEARTVSNAAPKFGDIDPIKVDENATGSIGDPIVATDADNDLLQYFIDNNGADKADNARFKMSTSGQLSLVKALNYELTGNEERDDAAATSGGTPDLDADTGAEVYTVKIKATDPSGAAARTTLTVELADVNEEPGFNKASKGQAALYIDENTAAAPTIYTHKSDRDATDDVVADFVATDGDNVEDIADDGTVTEASPVVDTITYELEGADEESFDIVDGALTSDTALRANREKKGSYSIAVVAVSTRGAGDDAVVKYDRLEVTVTVQDAEDTGMVTLSAREPQVGRAVLATLSDPDGSETAITWQWYRGGPEIATDDGFPTTAGLATIRDDSTGLTALEDDPELEDNNVCGDEGNTDGVSDTQACVIDGATSALYTPSDDDIVLDAGGNVTTAYRIHAVATYKDGSGGDRESTGVSSERPVEHSDPGNTAPVFPDQDLNTAGDQSDTAMRSVKENDKNAKVGEPISASDVDKDLLLYTISGADASSFNVGRKDGQLTVDGTLDYESQDMHTVMVTATDPSGAYDMITVMIEVTDADDAPTISLVRTDNAGPAFEGATASRSVDENMPAGTNVGDAVAATDEDDDTLTYSLSGSAYFEIDSATGQISTTMMLDYEAMSSHTVTVMADDGSGVENATASIDVTVDVGNVEECEDAGATAVADTSNAGAMADCEALLASRDALMGEDATRMLNWSADTPIADWYGVRKLSESGRVEWLYLHGVSSKDATDDAPARAEVKLNGTIPAGLGGLTEMTRLYLHRNNLAGEIPAELNDLTNLVWLRLYNNDLSGDIPDLSGMTSLQRLYIHENMLTGGVPTGVSDSVTHMLVQRNMLSGEIPDLSGLTSLVWLGLYDNMLSGDIPATVGGIADLEVLYLHGNDLTGMVPMEIGSLASLTNLWLKNNMLSGDLPSSLDNLTDLVRVRISGNSFTGCVPAALANAASTDTADTGLPTCGEGGQ